MKKIMKKAGLCIAVLLACVLSGWILLFVIFLIPNDNMFMHLYESVGALEQMNGNDEIIYGYSASFDGKFTDCLMLQQAVYEGNHSPVDAAMGIYRSSLGGDNWYPRDTLLDYLKGITHVEDSYARYWHGYLIILKPLLLLFNWGEIQFFQLIVQTLLLGLTVYEFGKRKMNKYALAYGITFLFLVPIVFPTSLSLSICFYIFVTANLIQLKWHEKIESQGWYLYFFLLTGAATSYFDFLTYPIVTLGIPMTLWLILRGEERIFTKVKKILGYSLGWGFGYIGMWASKWLLGSLILKQNVLADAGATLSERTGTIASDSRMISTVHVILDNIKEYQALPYRVLVLALFIGVIIFIIKYPGQQSWKSRILNCIPFCIVGFMPFAWYALALNHSGEHYMFTFRALVVTVFAGTSMLMSLFDMKDKTGKRKKYDKEKIL